MKRRVFIIAALIATVNMVFGADTTPPTASITSPAQNTQVSGKIEVLAAAKDNVAVKSVKFYKGSTYLGEDKTAPYSYSYDFSKDTGTQTIKVVAYDKSNNSKTASINVNVKGEIKTESVKLGEMHPVSGAYSPLDQTSWKNAKYVLGSKIEGNAMTFSLYSKNATKVLLEIYDKNTKQDAKYDYWMEKGSDNIWRAKIQKDSALNNCLYAFRVWGPNWEFSTEWKRGNSLAGFKADVDENGNRFNPNKVVYDPYGKEMSHDRETPEMLAANENAGMYGTGGATEIASLIADLKKIGTSQNVIDNLRWQYLYKSPSTGNVEVDRRIVDTGKWAPKSIAFEDYTSFGTKPAIKQKDAVIYEAHVKGLTNHASSAKLTSILTGIEGFENVKNVPDEYRGTYKGAGFMAKYLKSMGYNTIEFLPVHETANDINPSDKSGGNYWGYMTYSYFAPDRRYTSKENKDKPGGPTKEFKEMVKAFHDEGIEVYLDVVYNHTGESGLWDGAEWFDTKVPDGPDKTIWKQNPARASCAEITSLRGIDNAEYYALTGDNKKIYFETTGCGNNLYTNNQPARQLVLDSLKYWTDSMGLDGFRFDLAPVLGRGGPSYYTFDTNNQTIKDIAALGVAKNVEMIAEAWDTQWIDSQKYWDNGTEVENKYYPGGYQVSNFPNGWGEWNGFYRDAVRKFVKGDGNKTTDFPSFADVFNGSYGNIDRKTGHYNSGFNDNGGPQKSVNFISAHDGFTLADIVSYTQKMNSEKPVYVYKKDGSIEKTLDLGGQKWPFGPSDGGSSDNDSWNCNGNQDLRRQQFRNLWTIQMFSRGVPMNVYGDEFGRTQNGNNNTYNVDSVATWNNYNMINTDAPQLVPIEGGAYHNNLGKDFNPDNKNALFLFTKNLLKIRNQHEALRQENYNMEIAYAKNNGNPLENSDRCVRIHIKGSQVKDQDFLLMINTYTAKVDFKIPAAQSGKKWMRIIDTEGWAEGPYNNFWDLKDAAEIKDGYGVNPWSVVVLQEVNK